MLGLRCSAAVVLFYDGVIYVLGRFIRIVVITYLVVFTISVKALALYLYLQQPVQFMHMVEKAIYPVFDKIYARLFGIEPSNNIKPSYLPKKPQQVSNSNASAQQHLEADSLLQQEITTQFGNWQPLKAVKSLANIELDGVPFASLSEALKKIKDNSYLRIPSGVYQEPIFIRNHNVTIEGVGHVVFEKGITQGKGFILATGNDLRIKNIECRFIKADSKNGACIRLEGRGLQLDHVYFHSSETALLETSKEHGYIQISNSRFENLAANARAHSIYLNKASLHIKDSVIIGNRNQHSLKSRGPKTIVEQSILAELSATASRLIDISNGGELFVSGSLLQKGPNSENGQLIGFGLEGIKHTSNQVTIVDSVLLLDRPRGNYVLNQGEQQVAVRIENNVIVASSQQHPDNIQFKQRQDLKLPAYPAFPNMLCHLQRCATQTPQH